MTESHSPAGSADSGPEDTAKCPKPDIEPEAEDLTRDDVFHILQSQRRRRVLAYIRAYGDDGYARMQDIAEHIAALENDTTVENLRSQQRQRVYIALYQSHLPKMDDVGVVEYDKDRGHVRTTERTERFDGYLDRESIRLNDDEQPSVETASTGPADEPVDADESRGGTFTDWHRRYLYASGGSFLIIGAVWNGLLSGTVLSAGNVGLVVAIAFALLALTHWVTGSS
ncbi:hypothetical protein EGH21_20935 [Halomicroarcula sp. F13]|uniref:DUF7344 domain-containing protein n=1 Tax=Haloarcula rubra TaxID=2487747 RepID=A0AAW4PYY8_9EURY|nr:hypothetical protein [Halomicroarcula rubra]MBX0325497.1 hypothetical protein [Halomicroarcula rubra]